MKKVILIASPILTIVIFWYVLFLSVNEPLIVPSFQDVFRAFINILNGENLIIVLNSLFRLIISFIISALLGISLGFISAKSSYFEHWHRPLVTILRVIPVLSIIVILYIIVGSMIAPYIITFLMIFPLFYQATLESVKTIDPALIDVLRMNEMHLKESIRYVYIPSLLGPLSLTLCQSLGLGIKVLVMSEYLMQVKHSIGNEIFVARINLDYSTVFAWTIILIFIALLFETLHYYLKKNRA